MEPIITTTAVAIASLIFTEAMESAGEKLGRRSVESSRKLFELMKQKYPDVVEKEAKGQLSYSEALAQIETAVDQDSEVADAVLELSESVKAEPNQEVILQVLTNVIAHLQEHPRQTYNVQYNFQNDSSDKDFRTIPTDINNPLLKNTKKRQFYGKQIQSNIIGFYFSILSLILIVILVFVPLSIGIQQFLVAVITLFVVFSLSAFKQSTRYTEY